MNDKTAQYVIETLEKEKGRPFGAESLRKIKAELIKESDAAMMAASDYIILNFSTLPSAAKLLEIVQQEGKRIRLAEAKQREEEWKRTKGEDQYGRVDGKTFLSKDQHTEFAQRAILVLNLARVKGPCQELADGCLMMANLYPHVAEGYRELRQEVIGSMNRKKAEEEVFQEAAA